MSDIVQLYASANIRIAELERETARLQMELDASCNAEELRQVRAENAALRHDLNVANNWVTHHQNHCDDLIKENAVLREKDADWENAVLHARDHRCDEAHCTCVVPLIGKINKLERENATLKQRILDDNKTYGCELRDPSGTIWDHAKKLQTENDALRSALDQQANYQRELRPIRSR